MNWVEMMSMTTAEKEARIDAAISILRRGWCQGRLARWAFMVRPVAPLASYIQLVDAPPDAITVEQVRVVAAVCAEGAVRVSAGMPLELDGSTAVNEDWLFRAVNDKCREIHDMGVIHFNDEDGTTVDDVIVLFEKVKADL